MPVASKTRKRTIRKKKTVSKTVRKAVVKAGIQASVYTASGAKKGTMSLPKEIFGQPINMHLIAQAVRVYRANQRRGNASTKTRGEVQGSTRKIYRQKGTGRARHGAIRAPIFVGGGIVFGPKPRDYSLVFPHSMRRAALISALSWKQKEGNIAVIEGTDRMEPKTKRVASMFAAMTMPKTILCVVSDMGSFFVRAARNIERVRIVPAQQVTTYDVITHHSLCFTEAAIPLLAKRLQKEK